MRSKYFSLIAALVVALAMVALPVTANLVPTTFGFPVIVQNGSTSAFNQDTACATDFENINIQFPAYFDGVHLGASTLDLGVGVANDGALGVGTDGTGVGVAGDDGTGVGVGAECNGKRAALWPCEPCVPGHLPDRCADPGRYAH